MDKMVKPLSYYFQYTFLAQKEYNNVTAIQQRLSVGNLKRLFSRQRKYNGTTDVIFKYNKAKILCDFEIHCDHAIKKRKRDLVLIAKENKLFSNIGIACAFGEEVYCKKEEHSINMTGQLDRLSFYSRGNMQQYYL